MASVTLYRCTVPHFQGDLHVPVGTVFPEGSPQIAGNLAEYFVAEEHHIDTPKKTTKDTA